MRLALPYVAALLPLAIACSSDDVANNTFGDDDGSSTNDPTVVNPTEVTMTTEGSTTDEPTSGTPVDTSAGSSDEGNEGSICGDGMITGHEECDCGGFPCNAAGLNHKECLDVTDVTLPGMITGGILNCNPASCRFDTVGCTYCGDDEVNGNETCEPEEDLEDTCQSVGAGQAGQLNCNESTCQIDSTKCTDCVVKYEFAFDSCPDGFSAASLDPGAGASTWSCGEPTVYALGPGSMAPSSFGTNLSGPYNADESSALISSPIDMSACTDAGLTMNLRHWHNFEGSDETNSDGGLVQISEDGVVWTTIAPVDGKLYGDTPITASFAPVDGSLGFDANNSENSWGVSTFDLTPYVGQDALQVRFVFGSDSQNQFGGWYLDYVEILGSGAGV